MEVVQPPTDVGTKPGKAEPEKPAEEKKVERPKKRQRPTSEAEHIRIEEEKLRG